MDSYAKMVMDDKLQQSLESTLQSQAAQNLTPDTLPCVCVAHEQV